MLKFLFVLPLSFKEIEGKIRGERQKRKMEGTHER